MIKGWKNVFPTLCDEPCLVIGLVGKRYPSSTLEIFYCYTDSNILYSVETIYRCSFCLGIWFGNLLEQPSMLFYIKDLFMHERTWNLHVKGHSIQSVQCNAHGTLHNKWFIPPLYWRRVQGKYSTHMYHIKN